MSKRAVHVHYFRLLAVSPEKTPREKPQTAQRELCLSRVKQACQCFTFKMPPEASTLSENGQMFKSLKQCPVDMYLGMYIMHVGCIGDTSRHRQLPLDPQSKCEMASRYRPMC